MDYQNRANERCQAGKVSELGETKRQAECESCPDTGVLVERNSMHNTGHKLLPYEQCTGKEQHCRQQQPQESFWSAGHGNNGLQR